MVFCERCVKLSGLINAFCSALLLLKIYKAKQQKNSIITIISRKTGPLLSITPESPTHNYLELFLFFKGLLRIIIIWRRVFYWELNHS